MRTIEWSVPECGYRWDDVSRGYAKLVPIRKAAQTRSIRIPSDIYLKFIGMNATKQGILEFANDFGSLGGHDTFDFWLSERAAMEVVCDLCGPDRKAVWKPRADTGQGIWSVHWKITGLPSIFDGERETVAAAFGPQGDKTNNNFGNKAVIAAIINKQLRGHIRSEFIYVSSDKPGADRFELRHEPQNLLAIIWLQVAETVRRGEGTIEYCANPGCEKPFATAPGIRRRGSKYCSDSCKSKDWRRRTEYRRPKQATTKSKKAK